MFKSALLALAIAGTACSSPTAHNPSVSLDVQRVTASDQPDSQYTMVRIEVLIRNEGLVEAAPFLCAFALQKEAGDSHGFVTIATNGCIEQSERAPTISSNASHSFNLLANPKTADLAAATNFRILLPVFLGQSSQSTSVASLPFKIARGASAPDGS